MSTTTRRQFLATLGTAAVAVPLAAALPGLAAPKVAAALTPTITHFKPVEWHVRYAQFIMGVGGEFMVESRFGTDPIVRDYFVAGKVVMEPKERIVCYQDAIWKSTIILHNDGSSDWQVRNLKVEGYLRVQTVIWREDPEEWMSNVRYIADWQTPAAGIPNWNQASSLTAHDPLPITS